jgi:hypothetical protein
VGSRAGLGPVEKRKILPCRESNPGRRARRYTDISLLLHILLLIIIITPTVEVFWCI